MMIQMLNSEHAGVFFKDLAVVGNWFADLTVEVETPKELRRTSMCLKPPKKSKTSMILDSAQKCWTNSNNLNSTLSFAWKTASRVCPFGWTRKKVMLVLNIRYKKIFSYGMETVPPTRLDDHGNGRVKANARNTDPNTDDFFLFSSNLPPSTVSTNWLRDPY